MKSNTVDSSEHYKGQSHQREDVVNVWGCKTHRDKKHRLVEATQYHSIIQDGENQLLQDVIMTGLLFRQMVPTQASHRVFMQGIDPPPQRHIVSWSVSGNFETFFVVSVQN